MNEMKNAIEGNNSKIDLTEDRICDIEVRNTEIIQQRKTKQTNKKEWKRVKKAYLIYGIQSK